MGDNTALGRGGRDDGDRARGAAALSATAASEQALPARRKSATACCSTRTRVRCGSTISPTPRILEVSREAAVRASADYCAPSSLQVRLADDPAASEASPRLSRGGCAPTASRGRARAGGGIARSRARSAVVEITSHTVTFAGSARRWSSAQASRTGRTLEAALRRRTSLTPRRPPMSAWPSTGRQPRRDCLSDCVPGRRWRWLDLAGDPASLDGGSDRRSRWRSRAARAIYTPPGAAAIAGVAGRRRRRSGRVGQGTACPYSARRCQGEDGYGVRATGQGALARTASWRSPPIRCSSSPAIVGVMVRSAHARRPPSDAMLTGVAARSRT